MRQKLLRFGMVVTATAVVALVVAVLVLVTARAQVTANIVAVTARLTDADVVLRVSDRDGHHDIAAAGSGIDQNADSGPATRFRIGSITKTFVATVVLQLVDEGRIDLDAPIARQLPDPIPGGEQITVRQLLNHTSGLYDYMKEKGMSTNRWRGDDRFASYQPRELLATALRHEPYFAPGTRFRYSNTNYIVAGLLIEHVTGRPYGTEIADRILTPLGLTSTTVPGNDPGVAQPALAASRTIDGERTSVTDMNPSLDWAAGEMVSTTADLEKFFAALLSGELTSPYALAQMRRTVSMGGMGFHYGLGLQRFDPPCGDSVWGHGGELLGCVSYAFRSDRGRAMTMVTASADSSNELSMFAVVTSVYCLE
ncbi:serine hydrolase domain-containing protein [Nocardia sienata]|uniref:serine hydrolase domain-containing protein n=1 Tax=Nocardia sienata TaxID=248552 RepID=UPI0007A53D7F|nr:serine hydrolase domain-containing protein [Nocardia sienata]